MQQAGYHHANILATRLKSDIDSSNGEVLSILQEVLTNNLCPPTVMSEISEPTTITSHQANAMRVQTKMLTLLRQMQQELSSFCNTPTGTPTTATGIANTENRQKI